MYLRCLEKYIFVRFHWFFAYIFFYVVQVREFKVFRKSQGHKSLVPRPTLTNSLINWMEKFPGKVRSQQHLVTLVKFPAAVDIIRHPKVVQKEILTLINLTFKEQVSPRHRNLLRRHASLVEVELDICEFLFCGGWGWWSCWLESSRIRVSGIRKSQGRWKSHLLATFWHVYSQTNECQKNKLFFFGFICKAPLDNTSGFWAPPLDE